MSISRKTTIFFTSILIAACEPDTSNNERSAETIGDFRPSTDLKQGYQQIIEPDDKDFSSDTDSPPRKPRPTFPPVAKIASIPNVKIARIKSPKSVETESFECGRKLRPSQARAAFSGRAKVKQNEPRTFKRTEHLDIDFHVAKNLKKSESQLVIQITDGQGGSLSYSAHHWHPGKGRDSRVSIPIKWIEKHMKTENTTISFYVTGLHSGSHGQVVLSKNAKGDIIVRNPNDLLEFETKMPLAEEKPIGHTELESGYSSTGILPCFVHHVIYNDANSGDIWTQTGWHYKNAKHQWVQKYHNGNYVGSDWLNSSGCLSSPIYHGAGTYKFKVWTGARLHGIPNTSGGAPTINVIDHTTNYFTVFTAQTHVSSGTPTHLFYLGNSHQANALLAAVQSIEQEGGMMGTATTTVYTDPPEGRSYHRSGEVFIGHPAEASKYIIAHEMGHAFTYRTVSGRKLNGGDCSYKSVSCPDHSDGDGHAIDSKEHSQCSIQEGFAIFWGAAAYNYAFQSDCSYEGYDCEGSNDFPTRKLETDCNTPWGGKGTDIDWTRQFWDMRTASTPVTIPEMINWFSSASSWGRGDGYSKLNSEANSIGGNLNTVWDQFKGYNGIDH